MPAHTIERQPVPAANDAPMLRTPFTRAAREHVEPMHDRSTVLSGSASTNVANIDVPSHGFLRYVVIDVEATGGVQGVAAVAAAEDGPFSALRNITFTDLAGAPILFPFTGFQLYLANKYGAYVGASDPKSAPSFKPVDASGNFAFKLRIPLEIGGRDALGALQNQNNSTPFKVSYTVADADDIYAVKPATTLPTVRVKMYVETWTQPPASNPANGFPNEPNPTALGTVQFWSIIQENVNAAGQTIGISRTGNFIRNLILVARSTATGARSDAMFPDEIEVRFDNRQEEVVSKRLLKDRTFEHFGFAADVGVFVWDYTHDLDGKAGFELRNGWLPTTKATRLELAGVFAQAGTVEILINDVAPVGTAGDIFEQ